MLKRIFSIFAIAFIITGLFFEGYSLKCPVYADDTIDGWLNVTTNEQLVEAFKYYCKSRDLTIEGSVADAVTSFTTKTFNGICNTLGIDITALQGQLKYRTEGNQGLQFLFTSTGVEAYNRIFSQFLQDNELEVGDSNVNETVYSGDLFVDSSNNSCLVYIISSTVSSSTDYITTDKIVYEGSDYLYTNQYLYDLNSSSIDMPVRYGSSASANKLNIIRNTNPNTNTAYMNMTFNGSTPSRYSNICSAVSGTTFKGSLIVYRIQNTSSYILGSYTNDNSANHLERITKLGVIDLSDIQTSSGNITIVSNVINNNTYEGDTIINNEGDIINNYPDNPDTPDNPDLPPSNPSVPDSGGWQDFQMPTMPNDWLIYGMEKKFPFDIPFNIMFGLSLLNHEPEIPKFEGDIDLKICTWHYDIDLTPFDDIAKILRKFEVLAFIIGLAILTKELIMWG